MLPRHVDKEWGKGKLRLKFGKSVDNHPGRIFSTRVVRKSLKDGCYCRAGEISGLASCSAMDASGPKFIKHNSLSPEGALVYLFKPESASKDGVTACLTLTLNGTEYGCVQGKGYIVAEIEPGVYSAALVNKASFGFKLLEFPLELKAGEIVYLEYAYDRELSGELLDKSFASLGPFFSGNHVVAKINEPDALLKLDTLHLSR